MCVALQGLEFNNINLLKNSIQYFLREAVSEMFSNIFSELVKDETKFKIVKNPKHIEFLYHL